MGSLFGAIDAMVKRERERHPARRVTRSGLLRELLTDALAADPTGRRRWFDNWQRSLQYQPIEVTSRCSGRSQ